jgi:hypothetical protein
MPILVLRGQVAQKKKIDIYIKKLCRELGINRLWSKVIILNFETTLDSDSEGLCWGDTNEGYVDIHIARKSLGEKLSHESMMQTLAHYKCVTFMLQL